MNFEHASIQRSSFNDETSFSAINVIQKNWAEVFLITKKSLEENEVSSIKIKKQKSLKKTSKNTEKIINKNKRRIEEQQSLISFFFVQLIHFQTLNSVLFQLLKHEILYHLTSDQKYMIRSTSSSDSELQVKRHLTTKEWEALLISMIRSTWFSSS